MLDAEWSLDAAELVDWVEDEATDAPIYTLEAAVEASTAHQKAEKSEDPWQKGDPWIPGSRADRQQRRRAA